MEKHQQTTDSADSDTVVWLANQIFEAFPQEVAGLRFYILDRGCIYYQRVYRDGNLDAQIGIYRDAENGPCESCLAQAKTWENRVIDEKVAYNSKFQRNYLILQIFCENISSIWQVKGQSQTQTGKTPKRLRLT